MAFDRYKDGYDQCNPPFCSQDVRINVKSYSCSGGVFSVYWEIIDTYNRSLTVTSNEIRWSFNDEKCNNQLSAFNTTSPYYALIDAPNEDGTFYFKIKMTIENTFIESDSIYSLNLEDCKAITGCPSDWIDDPTTGSRKANFYIEYTTYNARDRIIVYGNYTEDCCVDDPPSSCVVLWDSTCVGTSRRSGRTLAKEEQWPISCSGRTCEDGGEGPGSYVAAKDVRATTTKNKDGIKADCFEVQESDLPIGVLIDPQCADTEDSEWFVYIEGPENFSYYKEGKNIKECEDMVVPGGTVIRAYYWNGPYCPSEIFQHDYFLYVKYSDFLHGLQGHQQIYFKYDDVCWELKGYLDWDIQPSSWMPINSILLNSISVDNIYSSGQLCCQGDSCPSEWEIDSVTGTYRALFYVEYNTYTVQSKIEVFSNSLCCEEVFSGNLLWDSGCIASINDENHDKPASRSGSYSPNYGSCNTSMLLPYDGYRSDCFYVHQADLPLCVKVTPGCNDQIGAIWSVLILGPSPGYYCLYEQGGGISNCDDTIETTTVGTTTVGTTTVGTTTVGTTTVGTTTVETTTVGTTTVGTTTVGTTTVGLPSGSGSPPAGSSCALFSPFVFYKYTDEEANKLYDLYSPQLENKTQEEKEDILIQLVINGEITPDQAILIAVRAGLNVTA